MSILTIILVLIIVGLILWLVNTYIPMPPGYKTFVNIACIVLLCIWLLHLIGALSYLGTLKI
jgi:hypothetical protein